MFNAALAFDWDAAVPDDERDALFETVARAVRRWRLQLPATLFLEIHAPLSHLAGQGLIVFSPFLAALLPGGARDVQRCAKLLENPDNLRRLIDRISETEREDKMEDKKKAGEKRDAARE